MGAPSVRKAEAFPLPHATLPVRSGMHSPVTVPFQSIIEIYRWQDFRGQLTILFDESSSPSNSCVLNQTHDYFLQIWSLCCVSSLPIVSPSNGSLPRRPILEDLFPLNFKPNVSPHAADGVSSISKSWPINLPAWPVSTPGLLQVPMNLVSHSDLTIPHPLALYLCYLISLPSLPCCVSSNPGHLPHFSPAHSVSSTWTIIHQTSAQDLLPPWRLRYPSLPMLSDCHLVLAVAILLHYSGYLINVFLSWRTQSPWRKGMCPLSGLTFESPESTRLHALW